MTKCDSERKFYSWLDLGNLEEKKVYFEDNVIPWIKRCNEYLEDGCWILWNGEKYYFKTLDKEEILHELLGEKVSNYFGLPSAHYIPAYGYIVCNNKIKKVFGVVSKMARKKDKEYAILKDVLSQKGYQNFDALEFLSKIDELFPNEPIQKQIRAFLVRDYFTNEYDRMNDELLIEKGSQIKLGYLTDYAEEFRLFNFNITCPNLYLLALNNQRIKKDAILMKYFSKALKLDLRNYIEEIKTERLIRIENKDFHRINQFQNIRRKKIRTNLSL